MDYTIMITRDDFTTLFIVDNDVDIIYLSDYKLKEEDKEYIDCYNLKDIPTIKILINNFYKLKLRIYYYYDYIIKKIIYYNYKRNLNIKNYIHFNKRITCK
jgi:hypothetical protein